METQMTKTQALKKIAAVALLAASIGAAHAHGYDQPQVYIAPQAITISHGGYSAGYSASYSAGYGHPMSQAVVYPRPVYREVYRQEYWPAPYYGHHHHHHHNRVYGHDYRPHHGGW